MSDWSPINLWPWLARGTIRRLTNYLSHDIMMFARVSHLRTCVRDLFFVSPTLSLSLSFVQTHPCVKYVCSYQNSPTKKLTAVDFTTVGSDACEKSRLSSPRIIPRSADSRSVQRARRAARTLLESRWCKSRVWCCAENNRRCDRRWKEVAAAAREESSYAISSLKIDFATNIDSWRVLRTHDNLCVRRSIPWRRPWSARSKSSMCENDVQYTNSLILRSFSFLSSYFGDVAHMLKSQPAEFENTEDNVEDLPRCVAARY